MKICLDGSIILSSAAKIDEICKPIKSILDIPYFRYGKIFNDGSRIVLCNQPDVMRFIFEEGNYPLSWHDCKKPIASFKTSPIRPKGTEPAFCRHLFN